MIRKLSLIKKKSINYQKEFFQHCSIEEKIDAHYVCVEIMSKTQLKFTKADGIEITQIDMILNSMWKQLIEDWNFIFLANKDLFKDYIGYKVYMFFFPSQKPILTKYNDPDMKYLISRVMYLENELPITCPLVSSLVKLSEARDKIRVKQYIKTLKGDKSIAVLTEDSPYRFWMNNEMTDYEFAQTLILSKDNFLTEQPEGFILRFHNDIYQAMLNDESTSRKIEKPKTFYEFLLNDIAKYSKSRDYISLITPGYVKSVCNIFEDYILNWCDKHTDVSDNIIAEDIEAPYLGEKPKINLEYVPSEKTKTLCKMSALNENIFKVMLANLSRKKKKNICILMNKIQIDAWNNMVMNLKIRNNHI